MVSRALRLAPLAILVALGGIASCADEADVPSDGRDGGDTFEGGTTPDDEAGANRKAGVGGDGGDGDDAGEGGTVAPFANDDAFAATEDETLVVTSPGLLANDSASLAVAMTGATAQGGTITVSSDGGFVYEPPPNFAGVDSFTYALDVPGSVTATAEITVAPVNDPPTLGVPANVVLDTDPGGVVRPAWLPAWSPGPANEASQQVSFTITAKGATTLLFDAPPSVDPATGDLSFAIQPPSFGAATFTLTAKDDGGGADSTSREFTITVNSPPIAAADSATGDEGSTCIQVDLLTNDSDADGDALTGRIVTTPIHGKLYSLDRTHHLVVGETFTGPICFTPNLRFFHGNDSFTYAAEDGRGGVSAAASASLVVLDIN